MAQGLGGPVQCLEDRKSSGLIVIPFATPFHFQVNHARVCGDVWQDQDDRLSVFFPDLLAGRQQFRLSTELGERPVIHVQPMAYLAKDVVENLNDDEGVDAFIFSGRFHHLS